MTAAAPNKLHQRFCQELARQLSQHRVLLIPGDWSGKKLYLELRDAATDLVLHRSADLPVDLIG
ncbi:hypothetical protein KBY58_04480 [Cyanobium sp. HWJ4-Hawea]|uniref:hypothetical protein n=1 Tax=Cyanobium sp. HWJ4-Hawea TaxID=2823713 RepID=UPI0020CEC045|nr:hypothetical protein [Cyanobium sp. HWJ4-Hawea]MCP9808686.1 hypothetical protein [Cyanobium sp. HWJ4-Hawea]